MSSRKIKLILGRTEPRAQDDYGASDSIELEMPYSAELFTALTKLLSEKVSYKVPNHSADLVPSRIELLQYSTRVEYW